ncbi:MAG: hypothetical protein IPK80_17650 [Nannocystis sp.]|nr:hypothetical protein [Nannocystis sp.]
MSYVTPQEKMIRRPLALILCFAFACAPGVDDDSGAETTSSATNTTSTSTTADPTAGGSTTTTTTDPTATTGETDAGTSTTTGAGGMCDPQAQDCPEGEKCTFYRDVANPNGANRCVPVVGDGQIGDVCMILNDDTDTCAKGLFCWGTEPDDAPGVCTEMCDSREQCSSGDPCTITNGGALPLCLPKCDPLAPVCPVGWACYDDWDFSDYWFCDRDKSGDQGKHGDGCATINGCDPGLICAVADTVDSETCLQSGSDGCCAVVCDLTEEVVCPGEKEKCISKYTDDPPLEYMNVGQCAIPQ